MMRSFSPKAPIFIAPLLLASLLLSCKTTQFAGDMHTRNIAQKTVVPEAASPVVSDAPAPTILTSTVEAVTATVETTPAPVPEVVPTPTPEPAKEPEPAPTPTPEPVKVPEPPKPTSEGRTETFQQTAVSGKADILVVIDNSGSMSQEQKNLSTKLDALIGALKDADWQIGVITTSVKVVNKVDSCQLTLVKSSDGDRDARFTKAVQAGTKGSDNEEGIRQAVNGLRCTEQPWVRDNSTVAVLIVSDEDNCSNGKGCNNSPAKSEQYLIDYVEKDMKRTVGVNAGFYGIYYPPSGKCSTAATKATIYQRLIDYKANGQTNYGNICDSNYQPTLTRMSDSIAKLLTNRFQLKNVPNAGTVKITGTKANGDAIGSDDYSLDQSMITFKFGSEPALNTELKVEYQVPIQ